MNLSNPQIRLTGSERSLPASKLLRAGDIHCVYESGMIRYISSGGTELIRCIYAAVRDRNWATIKPEITREEINCTHRSFTINLHVTYRNTAIHFEADYYLEGTEDNRIVLRMDGVAMNTFLKNRIGYCVLHPLQGVLGNSCVVTAPDAKTSRHFFPVRISPHSPMKNISSLAWENEAAMCMIDFSGDVWEMEDQRNWTDSSFKTYCTPLSFPFPAAIEEGTRVIQSVTLEIIPKVKAATGFDSCIRIFPEKNGIRLPLLGAGSESGRMFSVAEAALLKMTGLHHLRFDLKFSKSGWPSELRTAAANAFAAGASLELVIHFNGRIDEELGKLREEAAQYSDQIYRVWFVDGKSRLTDTRLNHQACTSLKELFPGSSIGAGTDAYFAEFNRNRFDAGGLDFVTFAVCPQVHASDIGSLTENIEAQCDVISSARELYPGRGIQVSPVTLRQRFNVVATGEDATEPEDQLPFAVDERQMSLFAAGWTLASIISLARGGADAATFFEATGWKGIIQGDTDPPKPELFAGRMGDIFPVYHVMRLLCRNRDATCIPCKTIPDLKCTALIVGCEPDRMMLIANHTSERVMVDVGDFNVAEYAAWDLTNVEQSFHLPGFLDQLPYRQMPDSSLYVDPFGFLFLRESRKEPFVTV